MTKRYNSFHVSTLKPYKDGSAQFPARAQEHRPPPLLEEDDGSTWYQIDDILAHRYHYNKKLQYKVKWKGYDASESTWKNDDEVDKTAYDAYWTRVGRDALPHPLKPKPPTKTKPSASSTSTSAAPPPAPPTTTATTATPHQARRATRAAAAATVPPTATAPATRRGRS